MGEMEMWVRTTVSPGSLSVWLYYGSWKFSQAYLTCTKIHRFHR